MICYILDSGCCPGGILALIFLVTEKENRFVKFHAVQSLFLCGTYLLVAIALAIAGAIFRVALSTADLGLIAILLTFGLRILVFIVFAVIFVLTGVKAYGGQWNKLPRIGTFSRALI